MISSNYCDVMVFRKLRFQDVFRPHEKENPEFSNSFGLKGVFKNLVTDWCGRAGLTEKIKLRFHMNSSSVVWMRFLILSTIKRLKTLMKTVTFDNDFKSRTF